MLIILGGESQNTEKTFGLRARWSTMGFMQQTVCPNSDKFLFFQVPNYMLNLTLWV